jgi:hypothetical protein
MGNLVDGGRVTPHFSGAVTTVDTDIPYTLEPQEYQIGLKVLGQRVTTAFLVDSPLLAIKLDRLN